MAWRHRIGSSGGHEAGSGHGCLREEVELWIGDGVHEGGRGGSAWHKAGVHS